LKERLPAASKDRKLGSGKIAESVSVDQETIRTPS
jgi:hypothetical protein